MSEVCKSAIWCRLNTGERRYTSVPKINMLFILYHVKFGDIVLHFLSKYDLNGNKIVL